MDWSESRNLMLLILLGLAIVAAGQFGLLTPEGVANLQAQASAWWQAHHTTVFLIGGALTAALTGFALWRFARTRAARAAILDNVAAGPTLYLLPRADWKKVKPEDVQVWVRMADSLPHEEHIAFEVSGNESETAFLLHGSKSGVRAALTQFIAEWPGLFRKPAQPDPAILNEGESLWWVELAPVGYEKPVQAVTDDPLRAILVELAAVLGRGRGMVQVVAARNFGAKRALGQKAFAARDEETPSKGVRALRAQEAKDLEARARATYLDVTVRVVGVAESEERAQGIARGLARAIASSFDGNNPLQPVRQGSDPNLVTRREPGRTGIWSANDLAYLAHMAGSDLMQIAPRIATAPARYLPADAEMRFDLSRYQTAFMEGS